MMINTAAVLGAAHLDVLNPPHVHPGLRLVRFQLHSQLVALVGEKLLESFCRHSRLKEVLWVLLDSLELKPGSCGSVVRGSWSAWTRKKVKPRVLAF